MLGEHGDNVHCVDLARALRDIAHGMKNPLTAAQMSLDLHAHEIDESHIAHLRRAISAVLAEVEDVWLTGLALADQRPPIAPELVDVGGVIEELVQDLDAHLPAVSVSRQGSCLAPLCPRYGTHALRRLLGTAQRLAQAPFSVRITGGESVEVEVPFLDDIDLRPIAPFAAAGLPASRLALPGAAFVLRAHGIEVTMRAPPPDQASAGQPWWLVLRWPP